MNLNWCHVGDFFGLSPTGREGTSIENLILTIRDHMIVRIEVADTSMDLVFYLRDRGWPFPHNLRPEPIIRGVEREQTRPPVDFRPA